MLQAVLIGREGCTIRVLEISSFWRVSIYTRTKTCKTCPFHPGRQTMPDACRGQLLARHPPGTEHKFHTSQTDSRRCTTMSQWVNPYKISHDGIANLGTSATGAISYLYFDVKRVQVVKSSDVAASTHWRRELRCKTTLIFTPWCHRKFVQQIAQTP